ncbi:MAG TPA: ferredoxin [Pseudolabrys sp.]|nr:ferredoxin [Pseudolabrys sp.]
MARSFRIEIDYDVCVGSRICSAIAPRVFGLNKEGQALVLDVLGDSPESIRMAAEGCPVSAIKVTEIGGEEV